MICRFLKNNTSKSSVPLTSWKYLSFLNCKISNRNNFYFSTESSLSEKSQLKSNEKKPIVKIKIVKKSEKKDEGKLDLKIPFCRYPILEKNSKEAEKPRICRGKRENIPYSAKKLNIPAKLIRGRHYYDALQLLRNVTKKGGPYVKRTLVNCRNNGLYMGYNDENLFVKEAFVGKGFRGRKIEYKARGKMGIIKKPKSSITIILEEKSTEDMYKMFLTGKCPPTFGHLFKLMYNSFIFESATFAFTFYRLFQMNADFETVRKYTHLTTAQGRYQRKKQFRRLISMIHTYYQERGTEISGRVISKYLIERSGEEFKRNMEEQEEQAALMSGSMRESHFQTNLKKTS